MIRLIILAILVAAFVAVFSLASRLGAFKEVAISKEEVPAFYLLGKMHVGAYHQIVPTLNEVEQWAKTHNIKCEETFAKFLDNPEVIEEPRLRAFAGCVISASEMEGAAHPEQNILPEMLPPRKYIKAIFSGSPSIGPFKVYTKVKEIEADERLRPESWNLEVYHIQGTEMVTTYYFPIK